MAYKDLGPNVSQKPQAVAPGGGQYTAEDHSFESVVIEQNKPPVDWEMNLIQEILGPSGSRKAFHTLLPSCWLTNGFLERTDNAASYVPVSPDPGVGTKANQLQIRGSDLIVNGWSIRFDLTNSVSVGTNLLTLPAPPVAGKRTDLVILEVWRALISPAPSSVNKSPSGQILRYGNAKSPDGPPVGNENLADDLIDPTFLQETSRRVQIQYRYRVVTGVDVITYQDGLDDPTVVANTAPYFSSLSVDGAATIYPYVKHPSDPGLWTAGVNSSVGVSALGTVDGMMYAIPICAVFRRNSTAFNRVSNPNGGGLMASGTSGRPDGLYSDQIVLNDILEMRKGVAWDLHEVLEKNMQSVLDGTLSTAAESTTNVAGPILSFHDDIGTSGHIGNPDGIRRNFSDRSVTESFVAKVVIGAPTSTVVFSLNSVRLSYDAGSVNVLSLMPSGSNIVGIGQVRRITASSDTDMLALASSVRVTQALLDVNVGPAVDRCTLTLNTNASVGDVILAELQIEYPSNSGTSRNMIGTDDFWTPPAANLPAWLDSSALSASVDATRKKLNTNYWWVNPGHRELSAVLPTVSQTASFFNPESAAIYIPDRLTGSVTINDGLNAPYGTTNYSYNSGYTKVVLSFTRPLQTSISATYVALRPLSPVGAAPGDSYQIFYTSSAVQSLPVPAGAQTINLTPRVISDLVHIISVGTGSPDDGFPFSGPGELIPVGVVPVLSSPESLLNTPGVMSISGFDASGGYLSLPAVVPYLPNPGQVTLYKSAPDTTVDGDGRNFWPRSDAGLFPVYSPSAQAQRLSSMQRHKVAISFLGELKQDFAPVGRKGTCVLVMVTRWADFDNANSVNLLSTTGTSCAAIYRVNGSIMNPRRVNP